jgi:hypothetical protein
MARRTGAAAHFVFNFTGCVRRFRVHLKVYPAICSAKTQPAPQPIRPVQGSLTGLDFVTSIFVNYVPIFVRPCEVVDQAQL